MKTTSTQTNEENAIVQNSYRDELYYLFGKEYEDRGVRYFEAMQRFPAITEGKLTADTITLFVTRLALNPSLVTIFSNANPIKTIGDIVNGDFNDVQISFVNDFLDDITINVRMKAEATYQAKLSALEDQIILSIKNCVGMSEHIKVVEDAINKTRHNLLAFYYLRKIGYYREIKQYGGQPG